MLCKYFYRKRWVVKLKKIKNLLMFMRIKTVCPFVVGGLKSAIIFNCNFLLVV